MILRDECARNGHDWLWLPEPVFVLSMGHGPGEPVNVQCSRCSATTWAHGHGPTNPPPPATATPTTDRS